MSAIFISYRRTDAPDATGRIFDHLKQTFGERRIFKDVDSIPYGVDFHKAIDEAVAGCDVFLAIIGKSWLTATDSTGLRRIDDPNDYVRLEIRSALTRNILVIPVLVEGAKMPTGAELPEEILALATRNAASVRPDPDFHPDFARLCEQIGFSMRGSLNTRPKVANQGQWKVAFGLLAMVVAIAASIFVLRLYQDFNAAERVNAGDREAESPPAIQYLGFAVNTYKNSKARSAPLRFAHADIKRLQEVLWRNNSKGRTIQSRILFDSEATRGNVLGQMRELAQSLNTGELGIISFSGYEFYDSTSGEFFLLPYDANSEDQNWNAISAEDIISATNDSKGRITIWLDTCNSGFMASQIARMNPEITTFASTQAGSFCYEFPEIGGGVFTTAMVQGLNGDADRDKNGQVLLSELALFVPARALEITVDYKLVQDVVITGNLIDFPMTRYGTSDNPMKNKGGTKNSAR